MQFPIRLAIGSTLLLALLLTAVNGRCADQLDVEQQIAERAKQYQQSLQQRAAEISPTFQAHIETKAQKTVEIGLEKWNNGEIGIQIALPRLAELQQIAQFLAQHFPSGLPSGSFEWTASIGGAVLTVSPAPSVLKLATVFRANDVSVRPFHRETSLSYFILIVCTVVLRQ